MNDQQRILHHGSTPDGIPQVLSNRIVRSCWFDLHRQGGCGAGEIVLSDSFLIRDIVEIGDWISFEGKPGDRWYLGRVEERTAEIPAQVRIRLEGMGIQLNEVFPGGFGVKADGVRPHHYAATDLFPYDPDYGDRTEDFAQSAEQLVKLLVSQYTRSTNIRYLPEFVETPVLSARVSSLTVRGEETLRTLIKELALRAQSASWGVDAEGRFFFLRPRPNLLSTFRERKDLITLRERRDRDLLFNRLLLTGDYVYDQRDASENVASRSYRWRANFVEPISRSQYGDHRLRIWLPWIRTQADATAFAREFFRTYSQPTTRYFVETLPQRELLSPWQGRVRIEDHAGSELTTARIETLRVLWDHAPRFRMELGPEDPRALWPEPPYDERWERPLRIDSAGGDVVLPSSIPSENEPLPGGGGGSGGSSSSTAISSEDWGSGSGPHHSESYYGSGPGTIDPGPSWKPSSSLSGVSSHSEESSGTHSSAETSLTVSSGGIASSSPLSSESSWISASEDLSSISSSEGTHSTDSSDLNSSHLSSLTDSVDPSLSSYEESTNVGSEPSSSSTPLTFVWSSSNDQTSDPELTSLSSSDGSAPHDSSSLQDYSSSLTTSDSDDSSDHGLDSSQSESGSDSTNAITFIWP